MSGTPALLLVHGWGFDAAFWAPLLRALGRDGAVTVDLGFGGCPIDAEIETDPVIAIGHSLGFLWIAEALAGREPEAPTPWPSALAAVRDRCVGLVSVNGFSRFGRSPEFLAGVAPRVLARMAARAAEAPADLLREFHDQCGVPRDARVGLQRPDAGRLAAGLGWLGDWDGRSAFEAAGLPCLALAAADDGVVREAHTASCFVDAADVRLTWSDTGSHVLPISRPDWCAEHIRRFVAELET